MKSGFLNKKTSISMQNSINANSIITISPEWKPKKERYSSYLKRLKIIWKRCYDSLNGDGSIWILTSNVFHNNVLFPSTLDIAENLIQEKFYIRNVITWYLPKSEKNRDRVFSNRYRNIIFGVKDANNYNFNKDPIREPHIWKTVEWGGRKSHYHELGKDPGNFWLLTESDNKGNKTAHIPLEFEQVIERCILVGSKDGDIILNPFSGQVQIRDVVEKNNREYVDEV